MQSSQASRSPAAAQCYSLTRSPDYAEHEHTQVHGFVATDATIASRTASLPPQELIWVGADGMNGRWLRPEEALELAAAIEHIANSHIERVFKERHRIFLANHPGACQPHPASAVSFVWLCGCGEIDHGNAKPALCANCENAWRWQRVANNDKAILHALCEGSGTYCETEGIALLKNRKGALQ